MKKDPIVISFSGKGGTGKTTTTTLFLKSFLNRKKYKDILLIDADPDSNLSNTLEIDVDKSVGQMLDEKSLFLKGENDYSKKFKFAFWDLIHERDNFDFISMGKTEGVGCYCMLNTALNKIINDTIKMYDLVLIDFDAGLEHFSRKTGTISDTLIITCDASLMSFDTAKRILKLVDHLSLPYYKKFILGSKIGEMEKEVIEANNNMGGLKISSFIPYDSEIAKKNLQGETLMSIGNENQAYKAIDKFIEDKLML